MNTLDNYESFIQHILGSESRSTDTLNFNLIGSTDDTQGRLASFQNSLVTRRNSYDSLLRRLESKWQEYRVKRRIATESYESLANRIRQLTMVSIKESEEIVVAIEAKRTFTTIKRQIRDVIGSLKRTKHDINHLKTQISEIKKKLRWEKTKDKNSNELSVEQIQAAWNQLPVGLQLLSIDMNDGYYTLTCRVGARYLKPVESVTAEKYSGYGQYSSRKDRAKLSKQGVPLDPLVFILRIEKSSGVCKIRIPNALTENVNSNNCRSTNGEHISTRPESDEYYVLYHPHAQSNQTNPRRIHNGNAGTSVSGCCQGSYSGKFKSAILGKNILNLGFWLTDFFTSADPNDSWGVYIFNLYPPHMLEAEIEQPEEVVSTRWNPQVYISEDKLQFVTTPAEDQKVTVVVDGEREVFKFSEIDKFKVPESFERMVVTPELGSSFQVLG